jgi:hypothetical protein
MKFRLNRKSFERLKALVRAGDFIDKPWSFSPADSNSLLGDPPNWTEYPLWFLGIGMTVPGDGADANRNYSKEDYAYAFGRGDVVNLAALRITIGRAKAAGENDISDAAAEVLAVAVQMDAEKTVASGKACDVNISFAAPVKIKAATASSKIPTFDADCYTGVAMQLEGFAHPVVIDYDGLDVTAHSRPVLRDHDPKRPIGHTTAIDVQAGILKATGEISVVSADAAEVVASGKNKFPWQISVGAKVRKSQFIAEGDTAQANGKTWSGPVIIARQTSLREISFLTLGADDNTSARIAANAAGKVTAMKKKFAAWAKAHGYAMADMADDGLAKAVKALYKAQMKCDADDPEDEDDDGTDDGDGDEKKKADSAAAALQIRAAAVNAGAVSASDTLVKDLRAAALGERQRISAITAKLEEYRPQVDAAKFAIIEAKAIGGEYDLDKTELELIKARRPERHAPNVNTGAGGQADGNIIAAACARSMGVGEKIAYKGLNEQAGNIAASMAGLTIHGMIAASASRLGMHVMPGGIDDVFLGDFLRADRESHRQQLKAHQQQNPQIRASSGAGFSSMSLTGITENILYKAMLEQYTLQVSVVSDIAYERDTNDFKPFKVYRLTASGDFQPIGPAGELKSFGLQDESYSNQVSTKGALLVLKREDIINDDMGALMQAPQALGRKAALNREKAVFTTFLSGLSIAAPGASVGKTANGFDFWSTGAKNLLTGGSSALSLASVSKARQQFLQQTDANGDPIGISPDRLLVPPELESTADNLFQGANLTVQALDLPAATSGSAAAQSGKQVVNLNQHKGKYRPIVSPYLGGSSSVAGASATQWALLCNPAGGMATVQVGYLKGQRTPIIRQVDTDAVMLGIAYQAIYDFGISLLDFRCGQYSAGA